MLSKSRFFKIFCIIVGLQLLLGITLFHYVGSSYYNIFIGSNTKQYTVKIDTRAEPAKELLDELMQQELPSLPLKYLIEYEGGGYAINQSCARYPTLLDIEFHNDYWQVVRSGTKVFYLFGAYYDKRASVLEGPLVRLLAMINETKNKYPPMYCQLWFKDRRLPKITPVIDYKVIWSWDTPSNLIYPTLLSCRMPQGFDRFQVPITVSLVAEHCANATNNLHVYYEHPYEEPPSTPPHISQMNNATLSPPIVTAPTLRTPLRATAAPKRHGGFAVCVKAMDFPYVDKSDRIIEWLELMRLLGAEKVTFYNAQVHPNITRVLRYYERTGFVEVRGLSMARGEPHSMPHFHHFIMGRGFLNRLLNEMIPYNDCFYRNLYLYDYIGIFDIDEVIMPLGNLTNWKQLVDSLKALPTKKQCKSWPSFCFLNIYYPGYPEKPLRHPDLPAHFYMLQHVDRVAKHLDQALAVKCLHSTQYVESVHNHYPIHWRIGCSPKMSPTNIGQMQHYREPYDLKMLSSPVVDDNIWRFSDQLIDRVSEIYKELELEQESDAK